ncbi:DapH/DapD/GlmU-related protein [Arthrobacter sp. Ld5]|uniref:DapH/DapD/GlmU-related protein n=1 Tax=Arthrobacter sp. Ld5 TaxID=649152 RepID=UPI003EC05F95
MELNDLLTALNAGTPINGDSPLHEVMHDVSREALRITGALNGGYREPARVRQLMSQLIGRPVDDSVTVFPPFYSDFGKNIILGERIFIKAGCKLQDQGGITIGDDCLIGHNVVMATLNHDLHPNKRADMHPAPIVIGRNVWVGSNATLLPGITIGDNAVIAAAAVVTKDVPANAVVVGSPARVARMIQD